MIVYILFYIVAAGTAALGARYSFTKVPTDYHAAIFESTGAALNDTTLVILRGLYRVIGGISLALALALTGITALLLPVAPWEASMVIGLSALLSGLPSGLIAYGIAQKYNVNAPWKLTLGLTALAVIGAAIGVVTGG
jgi:hypothetical protein